MNDSNEVPTTPDTEKQALIDKALGKPDLPQIAYDEERIFHLSKPVPYINPRTQQREMINQLKLRSPSGYDISKIGSTVNRTYNERGPGNSIRVLYARDVEAVKQYIIALSDTDVSLYNNLAGRDIARMYDWLYQELDAVLAVGN